MMKAFTASPMPASIVVRALLSLRNRSRHSKGSPGVDGKISRSRLPTS